MLIGMRGVTRPTYRIFSMKDQTNSKSAFWHNPGFDNGFNGAAGSSDQGPVMVGYWEKSIGEKGQKSHKVMHRAHFCKFFW